MTLPASFPARLVVVQHLDPRHRSLMAQILARRTVLPVREAREADALARAVDETVMLLNRLGEEFARTGDTAAAERCFDKARAAHERVAPMREAAIQNEELSVADLREKASG